MLTYKLTYFDKLGRGESIRYLFAVAGVNYKDIRIDRESEWPGLKDSMPFGQVPVLEVDGQMICQGHVIEQFLAKRFGLAGKTDLEEARAAMVVDCVEDFMQPLIAYRRSDDEEAKRKILKKYKEEGIPRFLMMLDRMLGNKNYFVGDQMTYADIVFTHYTDILEARIGCVVNWEKDWPQLVALRNKIYSHPKIAEMLSKHAKYAL